MARVFLTDETYNAATDGAEINGSAGTEQVNVFAGTTGLDVRSSVERVDLPGDIADFTFSSFGASLTIRDANGDIVATVSDAGGKQIVFGDGALDVAYDGTTNTLTLGGETVGSTAAAITPDASEIDTGTTSETAGTGTGGGEEPVALADALAALQAARVAESEADEALNADEDDNANDDADPLTSDAQEDVDAATAAVNAAELAVDAFAGGFAAAGPNAQDGIITDTRETLTTAVSDAEQAVADEEDLLDPGTVAAFDAAVAAQAAEDAAADALAEADTDLDAEIAKFDVNNGGTTAFTTPAEDEVTDGTDIIATLNASGTWVATAAGSDDEGISALLAALQAYTDADEAAADATAASDTADAALAQAETDNGDDTTALATETGNLETAQETLADFEEAVADFEAAEADLAAAEAAQEALQDAADAAADAATAALEAIENDPTDDPAGLGVPVLEGADNFTAGDDVFLYDPAGADVTPTGFGLNGMDMIFVGTGYTLLQVSDPDVITDDLGDASVLEIIAVDDGTDTVLHFEAQAFAGNTDNDGTSDTGYDAQITLVGVSGETFAIDADGFLSIA